MMRATVRTFDVPLARPLRTARGTIDTRYGFLVRVDSAEATGVGEATPLPGWTEPIDACHDALAAATDRLTSAGREAALDGLADTPAARHGLTLALLDHDARRAGVPLYRHLGADSPVESVPVNATIGDGDVGETVTAAEDARSRGFECLKVKVGARDHEADAERLAAVRERLGTGIALRADANGAWSRGQARRALESIASIDPEYVEQPLAAPDIEGHAALRGAGVDVALDETLASADPEAALDARAADVLILKPMVLGGLERAREVAAAARERGVGAVVTTTVDAVVARAGAVHLAASLPDPPHCGLATADRLADDLAADPAPVRDGAVVVPRASGHGVDLEGAP